MKNLGYFVCENHLWDWECDENMLSVQFDKCLTNLLVHIHRKCGGSWRILQLNCIIKLSWVSRLYLLISIIFLPLFYLRAHTGTFTPKPQKFLKFYIFNPIHTLEVICYSSLYLPQIPHVNCNKVYNENYFSEHTLLNNFNGRNLCMRDNLLTFSCSHSLL
jgi:hypothetical protein